MNNVSMIKSRKIRWGGHVEVMGVMKNTDRIVVRKPREKKPLQRPRCTWEDNFKMDLRKIGCFISDIISYQLSVELLH
jgi:hypothetical protein